MYVSPSQAQDPMDARSKTGRETSLRHYGSRTVQDFYLIPFYCKAWKQTAASSFAHLHSGYSIFTLLL
jgi:hypothetical protein